MSAFYVVLCKIVGEEKFPVCVCPDYATADRLSTGMTQRARRSLTTGIPQVNGTPVFSVAEAPYVDVDADVAAALSASVGRRAIQLPKGGR